MFTVTTAALDRLSEKLNTKELSAGDSLRLTRRAGGWRLKLDCIRAADMEFVHRGKKVLLVDGKVLQAMTSMILDVRSTGAGPRLKLTRRSANEDSEVELPLQ